MDKTDYNQELILALLREREQRRDYSHNYLFPYKDYLDANDPFTEFNCERDEGKANYMALIDQVLSLIHISLRHSLEKSTFSTLSRGSAYCSQPLSKCRSTITPVRMPLRWVGACSL